MQINFLTIIFAIINFIALGAIVFFIIKLVKSVTCSFNENKKVNKKLDKIIELVEKDRME